MSDKEYIEEFMRLVALLERKCARREVPVGNEGETRTEYFMTTMNMPNVEYLHPSDFIKGLWAIGKTVDLKTVRVIDDPDGPRETIEEEPVEEVPEIPAHLATCDPETCGKSDIDGGAITESADGEIDLAEGSGEINEEEEPTPEICSSCGYADAIKYNEDNKVTQCHNCGAVVSTPEEKAEQEAMREAMEQQAVDMGFKEPETVTGCDLCMKNVPTKEITIEDGKSICGDCIKAALVAPDHFNLVGPKDFWTKAELESFRYRNLQKIAGRDPEVPGNLNREELVTRLTERPKNFD